VTPKRAAGAWHGDRQLQPPGTQLAASIKSDHRLRALTGPVYAGRKSA